MDTQEGRRETYACIRDVGMAHNGQDKLDEEKDSGDISSRPSEEKEDQIVLYLEAHKENCNENQHVCVPKLVRHDTKSLSIGVPQ